MAFVVLNMGFSTTQKAKTSIVSSLSGAGSSLLLSGTVMGDSVNSADNMTAIMIPIKLITSGDTIDLNTTKATVSYISNDIQYDDVYTDACTLAGEFASPALAWAVAIGTGCVGATPFAVGGPAVTTAIIYWAVDNGDANTVLEQGEHAILSIGFNQTNDAPVPLDKVQIELTITGGATLTIERDVPSINGRVLILG